MLLEKLIINSKKGIIRDITFKKGLNLIVDETTVKNTDSGNNVGKTTFLRAIDFCFGSDGKDLYTDNEFKNNNQEVFDYLNENEIVFTLILKHNNIWYKLERGFTKNTFLKINDESFDSLALYKSEIELKIFNIKNSKPSLRQVMPKFIRKDSITMSNTIKFLHSTTTKKEYETIFLYLFGFSDQNLLEERLRNQKEIEKVKKTLIALKPESLQFIKQTLAITDKNIQSLELDVKNFKINASYEKEVESLNQIKNQILILTNQISRLRLKKDLNEESLKDLERSKSNIDPLVIAEIYQEAKRLIPTIQKEFDDVLTFHNQMILRKIDFIKKNLQETNQSLVTENRKLKLLLDEQSQILKRLSDTGSLAELERLQRELNKLYEKRGADNKLISLIEEYKIKLANLTITKNELNERVKEYLEKFDNNLTKFNYYFSEYSKKLYEGEEYILFYEIKEGDFDFKIDNITGNVGAGKKKAQIAAFDLAFISFLSEMKSKLPRFVLHDSTEDVSINQIITLFEIANSIDGQYIVTSLKDKFTTISSDFISANTIITLSQNNKFLKGSIF